MKSNAAVWTALVGCVLCGFLSLADEASQAFSSTFYVDSRTGDDQADGRSAETAFRTIPRARDAVRTLRKSGDWGMVRVVCAAGRYFIDKPLDFTVSDVNTVYDGPGAIVDGRMRVQGWKAQPDGAYVADVPGVKEGRVWFNQLWVNGRRADVARWPLRQRDWQYGRKRLDSVHPQSVSQTFVTNAVTQAVTVEQRLVGRPGDLDVLKGLSREALREVSLVVCHNWDVTRRIVIDFDPKKNEILTVGTPFYRHNPWAPWSGYWLENVPAGCSEPGTWYFDKPQGRIVYRPLPGETVESLEAYVPRTGLKRLMTARFRGVTFRGFSFVGSACAPERNSMTGGGLPAVLGRDWKAPGALQNDPIQAGVYDSEALLLEDAKDTAFEDCTFAHTGGYAIWIHERCQNCRLERCHVFDCGSGGIRAGTKDRGNPPTERLLVKNCLVEDCGLVNPCGVGIWLDEPRDSVVTHNHIRNIRYSGISVGWNWGYHGEGVRNEISYNLIEDIGLGGLTDLGGIYTLGRQYGTRIHDNVIRRIDGHTFCRWALYLDQGSSGITAYNNLCYDAPDGGFTFHFGRDNVVSNNIFAAGLANHMVNVGRAEKFKMMEFTRNIMWWDMKERYWDVREPCLAYRDYGVDRQPGTMVFSSNIWCCVNGEAKVRESRKTAKDKHPEPIAFAEWQKRGNGTGDILADPHFADPTARDFRFTAASQDVLRKIGFVPFDFTKAGIELKETH